MNHKTFLFALFVFYSMMLFGQNRPVPDYLLKQDFPDSVNHTVLMTFTDDTTTLSQVLNQYKGSKVFVDIWASWCRDCLVTLPEYNKLRKNTRKENIVYLLLSVDKEDQKWKSAIDRFKIKGEHYRFVKGWHNAFSAYIDLDWVPRYMIIDEAGNVIQGKSIHVDDKSLLNTLTEPSK